MKAIWDSDLIEGPEHGTKTIEMDRVPSAALNIGTSSVWSEPQYFL